MPRCKKCNAEIRFITNPKTHKVVPVDAEPRLMILNENGPDHGYSTQLFTQVRGRFVGALDDLDDREIHSVYISHLNTCTNPNHFSNWGKGRS